MMLRCFLFSLLVSITPVWACSVPVFRYALEHWPADPYEAVVLHRGPLTPEQAALVRDLGPEGLAGQLHANLAARTVDLDAHPFPEESVTGALPRLVLRTPKTARNPTTVWSGEFTAETVGQLLDSPARREIVERLAGGQSAVWVLLESGDRAKDAAAATLLDARLADLAGTLTLPRLDPHDIVNGLVSIAQEDLRLEFSVLRVARGDTAEAPFIGTLLGTERDLRAAREPIAIPVFGRGRALYAFVGAGLKRETIDQAASFLIGKCSCQVKEQNPGADLLLAADWEALVKAQAAAAPDLPTLAELARSAPVTVSISSANAQPPASDESAVNVRGLCIAAAFVALGSFVARQFARRRKG